MSRAWTQLEQFAHCLPEQSGQTTRAFVPRREVSILVRVLFVQLLFLPVPSGALLCQSMLEHDFDVLHYRLNVALDDKGRSVEGNVTVTFIPKIDQLDQIKLHSVDLQIHSIELEGREAVPYQTESGSLIIWLGREFERSDTVHLKIAYKSIHPRKGLSFITADRTYFNTSSQIWSQNWDEYARYWYPCYDEPDDKATFETIIRVSGSKKVVSNGALVDVTMDTKSGGTIYSWFQDKPIHTAVHAVVAGDFAVVRDSVDTISLMYYVDRQDSALVKSAFAHTGDMVRFFSHHIGFHYPWQKLAYVALEGFRYGGMENVSCVFLRSEELKVLRNTTAHSFDRLIAHELAHQWWGNLVTYTDWSQLWLSEGFATYFSALYIEHRSGHEIFQREIEAIIARYLEEDSTKFRRPLVYTRTRNGEDMLNRHTYDKGALVVHMLRYVLGDKLFWKALGHYARKHAFGNVDSDDLRVAIEESTGKDIGWFFDQWVYGAGYPEFRVTWMRIPDENTLRCRVQQVQHIDALTPLFRMPIDVEVETEDGKQRHRVLIDRQDQEFQIQITSDPLDVKIDPGRWILKTLQMRKVDSFSH